MFADLPDARSMRAHMDDIRDATVNEYADEVISALLHLWRPDLEKPEVKVTYARCVYAKTFLARGKYVPGDIKDGYTCVPNPDDYTADLEARLLSLGLTVKELGKVDGFGGRSRNYTVTLENPFTRPRLLCTNPKFWATYELNLDADLKRLAKEVHDHVARGRCTFVLKTRPTYHSNLVKVAEQLRPKGYACKIHTGQVEDWIEISPAE